MGFNDEYMKLRKKRLGEAEKEADKKAENKTFTDTYNELRNERLESTPRDLRGEYLTMKARGVIGADYDDDAWKSALAELQTKGDAWHEEMAAKRKKAEEEKADNSGWFSAGAFDDGYDFGDITKTILGTTTDAVDNLVTGVAEFGEGLVDGLATATGAVGGFFGADEFQEDVARFVADDLIDGEAVGNVVGYVNPLKWGNELLNGGDAEANSILGEQFDSTIQSTGQYLGQLGLQMVGIPWWLTSGVAGVGHGTEQALNDPNDPATFEEAALYGAINGAAEVAFEKLGGLGYGGKTLTDNILGPFTRGITSKAARTLVNLGIDAAGEGFEEFLTSVVTRMGSAIYKDDSIGELLTSEEAVDEYINSFIGGALMGGGLNGINAVNHAINPKKQGRDYKTGLTDNEQKVYNKVLEAEIAKAEEGGKKLTLKERAKIEQQVEQDLQKGFISTDTIEEVLGEDTYKAYKDAVANEDAIKKEYADLGSKEYLDPAEYERYVELGKLIEETDSTQLKAEADKSFAELLKKDTYLQNSYNERVRRSQAFDADLSQYTDENAKKTVENAIKYGMHNGTDAHEFVDFAAKLAAKKGYVVDFTNTRMLKESIENGNEYNLEAGAERVEAFVSESKKKIVLNMDAEKSRSSLFGHELTHTLETAGAYDQLQKYIYEYAKQKGEYDSRLSDIESRYSKVKADVQKELTADLCGDYLMTDYDFISQLATKDRNVFQKVYDEIKYMLKLATTGSKEARALEKAKHYYEKALRERAEVSQKEELGDSKTQYSIRKEEPPKKTGIAYKVFYVKDGKLYPPMVANPGGADTPVGVWLNADVGTAADPSKTGRLQVKAGGKGTQGGSGSLAFRPGWHLGDIPRARQFDRVNPETGKKELFPKDFVWAECEYAMDVDYQEEAMSYGYTENGKFRHSYAGLPKLPENGYYRYRTNPKPDTVPWVITGAMKVNRILSDAEVNEILKKNGVEPVHRQGGDVELSALGFGDVKYSLSDSDGKKLTKEQSEFFKDSKVRDENGNLLTVYHTTNNDFTVFDKSKQGEATGDDNTYLGFFFSDDAEYLQNFPQFQNGKTDAYYLNVTNPIDMTNISKEAFMDVVEVLGGDVDTAADVYEEMKMENGGETPHLIYLLQETGADTTYGEFIEELKPHYAELMAKGYDGVVNYLSESRGVKEYIVLDSNQAKLTSNATPTSDPDIRYSLSAETDKQYLDAVKRGDTETAQKIVSDVAKEAMPDSKLRTPDGNLRVVYHGTNTGDFTVFNPDYIGMSSGDDGFFGMGFYFAYSKGEASYYGAKRVIPAYLNLTNPFDFDRELQTYKGKKASSGYAPDAVALMNFADKFPDIAKDVKIAVVPKGDDTYQSISLQEFSEAFKDVIDNKTFDYQELTNEYGESETLVVADPTVHEYEWNGEKHTYNDYGFQKRWWGKPNDLDVAYEYLSNSVYSDIDMIRRTRLILDNNRAFTDALKARGYDGAIQSEYGDEAVAFEPSQIKLADAVTYDDQGNVIPLSERFNASNDDIRYSLSAETDKSYLDAVNRGDTAAAQKMVDKAAENAGYTIKAYHGTPNTEFTVFDKDRLGKGNDQYGAGFYFTTDKTGATHYGNRVIDAVLSIKNPIRFTATTESGRNLIDADVELTSKQAYEVVKRLPGIYDAEESPLGDYFDAYWEVGAKDWMIRELAEQYRDVGYLDSDLFRNYPNELHEALRDVVGYDGVEVTFESTGEKFYVAWFDNQMKSADPVTYDDNGNVIPLSERFNTGNNDIRHSLAKGAEKTYGNYNGKLRDLVLAPTAEAQEDVAPVAKTWRDTIDTLRDPEFDEDGAWTKEYLDHHEGIKTEISVDAIKEVISAVDNGLTPEELKAKSEEALKGYEQEQAKKPRGESYTDKELLTLHALYSRYSLYDSAARDPKFIEDLRYSLTEDGQADLEAQARLASLTEDDMPPETIAPYVPEKEPITVDDKSLGTITQKANEFLGLNAKDSALLADMIRDYARDENFTERDLHEAIRENFHYTEEMENDADEITQAKQYMRGVTLYIDPDYKGDFHGKNKDGYNAFRREHFGHFHLTTKPTSFAMGVDSFYEELSDLYPTLFPADIDNVADRLQRMGEVADMKPETVSRSMEYDDDVIQEVVGIINNELTQYSQGETLRLLDESASAFYKSVEAKDIAPSAEYIDEDGQLTMAPDEASQQDPAKKEIQRVNNRLEQERARLRTELQQKKAQAQAIADNKDAFISKKASELYEELRNLKKGVRASKDLGALLDFGYEWSAVKAALTNIRYSPDKRVNQNSVIESIAREMLNSHYEDAVYSLDELEFEYQDKIAKLEAGAESQRQQARAATASQATAESKPRTRKDLHQEKIDSLDKALAKKGYSLLDVLKKGKNLSTWRTVDNTPQRIFEKTFGYEAGQILADETVNKVAQNESEGIKWLNTITDRKNGLLAKLSKQYNIKPGSKESAAAQMFAEGFYVNDKGEYIKYGVEELEKDFRDANVRANIIGLAGDKRIRQFYDDTLQAINESRARNLYPEIPRLENYFLHFRAMDDTYSKIGLPFNPNDIKAKDLPTDLNGVTPDLKPGQPFFASAMHRSGNKTTHDLLGGLERYATSAKNQIYHIDDIQTFRAFRNFVADTFGQSKGLEGLDLLTETEAEERIKEVFDAHLSTFAKFLNEEANVLAGKTALIDRGIEGIIGRRGMMFVDTVNKQVGSNMVGYNVSSSLTNLLAGVQAIAKTNKASAVKAFAQTTASKFGSLFGNTNSFAENDPFLIRRKGAERFHRTPFQKIGDAGYFLASAVDNVTSEFVVRAKYNEFIKKGMGQQQAIEEADKWAARLMGDRSLGQMPHLYNSKMLGLVTKFQLEVRNQLDSQFYDTVQEAKASNKDIQSGLERNSKIAAKVTKTLFELAVLQHVFGKAFEAVAGYNPAFDIIGVLATAFGFDDEEDSEDTVLDNVEQGFLELLEDLPYTSTFTGGRIPISSALPIEELVTGQDEYGNEKSRLETLAEIAPYYILPGGYGQLKKTAQGLAMFDDDLPVPGSYTDSGSLRFPVEDTFGSRLQAGIFGQWASENARDYFNNGRKPLNEKQTQEYIDSEMSIDEYWEYREGLSGLSTLAEKADYIYDLDIPTWKKNLLINNIADRKEDIDMSDYGNYDSFAEFDYAMKNPEKYNFLTENGISYQEYVGADEDTKEAYNWAYKNPEEYRMWKAVGDDVTAFRQYAKDIYDLEADKDEEGKSIRGSRKEKVIDYVSNLDVDYGVKCILFKSEYPADDTYNAEILDYLNSREDLTYDDIKTILSELGFTVYDDGTVEW